MHPLYLLTIYNFFHVRSLFLGFSAPSKSKRQKIVKYVLRNKIDSQFDCMKLNGIVIEWVCASLSWAHRCSSNIDRFVCAIVSAPSLIHSFCFALFKSSNVMTKWTISNWIRCFFCAPFSSSVLVYSISVRHLAILWFQWNCVKRYLHQNKKKKCILTVLNSVQ